jgi:guanylate kinase
MTGRGVVLYGPPAVGKDTVTGALSRLDPQYAQFQRLKVGSGRTVGYRVGTSEQLAQLRAAGDVVYENSRYGSTYVLDRPGLDAAFAVGVPVAHLGQVAGVRTLMAGYPAAWLIVLLWCSREVTEARSIARGDADTAARLAAWDATEQDLASDSVAWDLTVDTAVTEPTDTARRVDRLLRDHAEATSA